MELRIGSIVENKRNWPGIPFAVIGVLANGEYLAVHTMPIDSLDGWEFKDKTAAVADPANLNEGVMLKKAGSTDVYQVIYNNHSGIVLAGRFFRIIDLSEWNILRH